MIYLGVLLVFQKRWQWLHETMRNPRILLTHAPAALLLAVNWLTYIWAVTENRIVDCTLGFFIAPLVNVLFGMVFQHERLRPWQLAAITLACAGALGLTLQKGELPWTALILAFSMGAYALLQKQAHLHSAEGLWLEMAMLSIPAAGYLFHLEHDGASALRHAGPAMAILLSLAGVVTAAPLLLYAASVRAISLSTLGILQFIVPTIQLLIGVFLYGEDFSTARLIGFGLVWSAVVIYCCANLWERRCPALRYVR
jgi:chloramphenicol-sensitive protein RarD